MSTTHNNTEWIPQQIKVFSRWVESHLTEGKADAQVTDVTKDLSNGVALVELAEILTHKEAPHKWAHDPKHIAQMVTNSDMAIDMFTKDGVQFVGISGKDIHDSKQKLVLGLVWTLILRYSIGQSISTDSKTNSSDTSTTTPASSKNNKDALMQWAIERTENYPNIHNFQPVDLSMCALLDSYVPNKVNYYSLDPKDTEHNAELATSVMKDLGIPAFLDSDDLQETTVDEKALLTQLSTAKVIFEKLPPPTSRSLADETNNVESDYALTQSNQTFEAIVDDVISIGDVAKEEKEFMFESDSDASEKESVVQTREINIEQQQQHDEAMREIEEQMRRDQEENKNLPDKIVIDGQEFTNIRVREISLEPKATEDKKSTEVKEETESTEVKSEIESSNETLLKQEEITAAKEVEKEFVSQPVVGDNSQYAGRKFGLIMTLNEADYNNGEKVDFENNELLFGDNIQFALTMVKDKQAFLNPAGLKLTIAEPNIENDVFQQFTFGKDNWNTVIDSVQQQGMVWDVSDEYNLNPPSGTPFYLFPFHGRHNQHFVYKDGMIYAQQNGQVVTFVGGEEPLIMMPPSNELKARQTFTLQLL